LPTPSPSPLDIKAIRRDTPGTANRIRPDNAGAGLMPRQTPQAAIGGHEAADRERIDSVYGPPGPAAGRAPGRHRPARQPGSGMPWSVGGLEDGCVLEVCRVEGGKRAEYAGSWCTRVGARGAGVAE
ncbi:hypothetical protein SIN09_34145, partial [Streptomyces sp. F8]|nr:hypothetical protein [Streptomyces sp. F8]